MSLRRGSVAAEVQSVTLCEDCLWLFGSTVVSVLRASYSMRALTPCTFRWLWVTNPASAVHQWSLNFLGAAVGCWATWLLATRHTDERVLDFALPLAFVAFLGVTGYLPRFAVGIAFAGEKLAELISKVGR